MTDQDKQKLNEKLARWVGWRQLPKGKKGYHQRYIDGKIVRFMNWISPEYTDNEPYMSQDNPPNFTDSLDACFNWLVPKLWSCAVEWYSTRNNYRSQVYDGCPHSSIIFTEAETPSLALCLAIEKLIDAEAK